jgi:sugar phosphate permease
MIVVILAFLLQHAFRAPYWVLEKKYLTNFTNDNNRVNILSANAFTEGIGRTIVSFLCGLLLEYYSTSIAYIIVGVVGLIIILLILKYMKTRLGLKPKEYDKEDIIML